VCMFVCVFVYINAGMPNCLASDQSGAGLKKNNDAGTGPVPDQSKAVRNFFGLVRVRYAARRSKTDQNGHTTRRTARLDAVFIEL
jgi:hypothetical protein